MNLGGSKVDRGTVNRGMLKVMIVELLRID